MPVGELRLIRRLAEFIDKAFKGDLWSNQGGSLGVYDEYEDDYAWECPECGETVSCLAWHNKRM